MMNSRERLLKALNQEVPDLLLVTAHHVMPSFLEDIDAIKPIENE